MSDHVLCVVCRTFFAVHEEHGTNQCPGCGQVYHWEEGYEIQLTAEQIEALRKLKENA